MRRDLIAMGSVAAIAGIALALVLTAWFGARSSGPPAGLRPAPAAVSAETAPVKPAATRKQIHKRHNRRHHRRHSSRGGNAGSRSVVAQAQPASPAQTTPVVQPAPTQTVVSPAPTPAPVRQQSRPAPKRSSPSGAFFDDSG